MEAFHNNLDIKHKYLERVRAHRKADNLIQGIGWANGRGCAVGCTLEAYDHSLYPLELGIPEWLARLEDAIFEKIPNDKAMLWPERFLAAINPGADLEKVKMPFIVHVLNQTIASMDACVFDRDKNPDVVKVIEGSRAAVVEMIRCHRDGLDLAAAKSAAESAASAASAAWSASAASAAWSAKSAAARSAKSAAESAAFAAARSAESTAWSAARSAESAAWSAAAFAAARSAESTAFAAARSAVSAAWSDAAFAARSAAESAVWSAESTAWSAASAAAYKNYADNLIALLEECR